MSVRGPGGWRVSVWLHEKLGKEANVGSCRQQGTPDGECTVRARLHCGSGSFPSRSWGRERRLTVAGGCTCPECKKGDRDRRPEAFEFHLEGSDCYIAFRSHECPEFQRNKQVNEFQKGLTVSIFWAKYFSVLRSLHSEENEIPDSPWPPRGKEGLSF